MTAREMQMEFERRIALMDPDFEIKEKITSDTIFSFLNAYTERFVRNNYLQEDVVEDGSRAQKKVIDALKGLITRRLLTTKIIIEYNSDNCSVSFALPDDYFLYIRSNSNTGNVPEQEPEQFEEQCLLTEDSSKIQLETSASILLEQQENIEKKQIVEVSYNTIIPNKIIKEDDVEKVLTTKYNVPIIRNPYIIMHSDNNENQQTYLTAIHDIYTNINGIDLVYCRKPKPFNVIGVDGVNILNHCELPENVHMEIVEGAVEMFITEAKYRLNMKQN